MAQRFMDPSALKSDGSTQQGKSVCLELRVRSDKVLGQQQQSQMRGLEASPYFQAANNKIPGTTLDPRSLQMPQQFNQQLQGQTLKVNAIQQMQALQGGQLHPQFQVQPQTTQTAAPQAASKPRVKKTGKSSGSSSSSEDDLDIEEEPEQKPAAITIAKPTDERGKLLWEVVDAVWTPRNKPAPPEKIRSAISFIGGAVRNFREKWKAANDALKQAELPDSKTKDQAERLKDTVKSYRDTMETLAGRVALFGHPSILSRYVLVNKSISIIIVPGISHTRQTCLHVCDVGAAGQSTELNNSDVFLLIAAWRYVILRFAISIQWRTEGLDSSISCYKSSSQHKCPNIS